MHINKIRKKIKAFTLVELLISIVIVGVLGVVGIAGYSQFTEKARISKVASDMVQLRDNLIASDDNDDSYFISADGIIYQGSDKGNVLTQEQFETLVNKIYPDILSNEDGVEKKIYISDDGTEVFTTYLKNGECIFTVWNVDDGSVETKTINEGADTTAVIANLKRGDELEGDLYTDSEDYTNGTTYVDTEPTSTGDSTIDSIVSVLESKINDAGHYIELELDTSSYKLRAVLKDKDKQVISTSSSIDLSGEVTNIEYNSSTKSVILTFNDGSTASTNLTDMLNNYATITALDSERNRAMSAETSLQKQISDNLTTAIEEYAEKYFLNQSEKISSDMSILNAALASKQDKLTAGDNIYINNNVISAVDTKYIAGTNVTISGNNVISAKDTTYSNATTSVAGLMSAADKSKLNSIEEGATKTIVDSAISSSSTNPVQNKIIAAALDNKQNILYAGNNITISGSTISATVGVKSISQSSSDGHALTINTNGSTTTITIPDNDTTYDVVTSSSNGLMSSSDKSKLDSLVSASSGYATTGDVPTKVSQLTNDAGYITASSSITGNAATATKATKDSNGNTIVSTYIKSITSNGTTITYTKGNGDTGTLTTQDTNTTYSLTQDSSDGHKITLTSSLGTSQTITVPDNNTTYSKLSQFTNDSGYITSSGSITGNAATATKATQDGSGNTITSTYIKGLSVSGTTLTYTKGDGKTGTVTLPSGGTTYTAGSNITISGTTISASVPTKVSQLTNDSGYITSSGSAHPKFENSTWYIVGDDAYIGDHDQAGTFCIKGANGSPSIMLYNSDNTYNSTVITSATISSQSVNYASSSNYSNSSGYASSAGNSDKVDGYHIGYKEFAVTTDGNGNFSTGLNVNNYAVIAIKNFRDVGYYSSWLAFSPGTWNGGSQWECGFHCSAGNTTIYVGIWYLSW